jgi:hypothetical protein
MNSFVSIKEAITLYNNNVTETFGNNLPIVALNERKKMNVMIESLISTIHQACDIVDDKFKYPSFHLVTQSHTTASVPIGDISLVVAGDELTITDNDESDSMDSINFAVGKVIHVGSSASGGNDGSYIVKAYTSINEIVVTAIAGGITSNNDATAIVTANNKDDNINFGETTTDDTTPPNLFPGKLSGITNCSIYNKGNEVLYYYIISLQMLYDEVHSSLKVKIGDAKYDISIASDKCLFPIMVDKSICTYQILELVPPSDDIIWTKSSTIQDHIHKSLIENVDLNLFAAEIDRAISKTKRTEETLKIKQKLEDITQ